MAVKRSELELEKAMNGEYDFMETEQEVMNDGSDSMKLEEEAMVDDYDSMEPEEGRLRMTCDSFYFPKEGLLGEDSHFVCNEKLTIGVADGVGGWAVHGVDAGKYAEDLMSNSFVALFNEPQGAVDPKRVLHQAYTKTNALGSSTACIITLRDDDCLHAANLGDSGFMVFRNNKLVYQSPTQQHYFNCPYQLGADENSDSSSSADELKVSVNDGDIVIAGTDGLFDNMYPSEIEEILDDKADCVSASQLAWFIALIASYNSKDNQFYSPFARASGDVQMLGGKVDDITVVVGLIKSSA